MNFIKYSLDIIKTIVNEIVVDDKVARLFFIANSDLLYFFTMKSKS